MSKVERKSSIALKKVDKNNAIAYKPIYGRLTRVMKCVKLGFTWDRLLSREKERMDSPTKVTKDEGII